MGFNRFFQKIFSKENSRTERCKKDRLPAALFAAIFPAIIVIAAAAVHYARLGKENTLLPRLSGFLFFTLLNIFLPGRFPAPHMPFGFIGLEKRLDCQKQRVIFPFQHLGDVFMNRRF